MKISALQAFVIAAREGSFSGAAELLHLTQPGLSKRIVTLENELKYPLFDRLSNGVLLTEAGRLLLPHAEAIVDRAGAMKAALINLDNELSGLVRVGTTQHIALYHLQEALQRFSQHYSHVELNIDFLSSAEAERKLLAGQLDLACITEPLAPQPQLDYQRIGDEKLVFVVAKGHALSGIERLTLKDLAQFRAILPSPQAFTRQYVDQVFREREIALEVMEPSDYFEVLRIMTATGMGWSLLAEGMVDERFYRLPLAEFEIRRGLVVAHHRERTLSPACLQFMQHCSQL
ncbi:MAG: LysR family transcriptional regulator [Marinobacterium sp.]|nr:LysR family transcriptional regulator [Marinobacterium sp.]